MTLRNLAVGPIHVDLYLKRSNDDVSISLLSKRAQVEIVIYH